MSSGWKLVRVNPGFTSTGSIVATFHRVCRTTAGTRAWVDVRTIIVEPDGLTSYYVNAYGQQSMKPHRRDLMHKLCCQAVAYVQLTGDVAGFPEQELV